MMNIEYAFESGTFYCTGTLQLAALFKKVWTVENDKLLVEFARKNYNNIDNIEFLYGDSSIQLSKILAIHEEPFLFFLDAHWFSTSPRKEFQVESQCPILNELESIKMHLKNKKQSVILIDDAAMFLKSLPPQFNSEDFPSIPVLTKKLQEAINAEFIDIIDDVIVAGSFILQDILKEYEKDKNIYGAPYMKYL